MRTVCHGAITDDEESRIRTMITSLDTISGWTFTQAPKFTDCFGTPQDIIVVNTPVGASGTASNDVKDYGIPVWTTVGGLQGGLVDLTEDVGVSGQYQNWTVCQARVDGNDIYAKGTSATQDANGMNHAAAHAIEGCLGIGGRTTGSAFASRNSFAPATVATSISTGETCALAAFSLVNPGHFTIAPIGCPSD